jgi:hypothetical protein
VVGRDGGGVCTSGRLRGRGEGCAQFFAGTESRADVVGEGTAFGAAVGCGAEVVAAARTETASGSVLAELEPAREDVVDGDASGDGEQSGLGEVIEACGGFGGDGGRDN